MFFAEVDAEAEFAYLADEFWCLGLVEWHGVEWFVGPLACCVVVLVAVFVPVVFAVDVVVGELGVFGVVDVESPACVSVGFIYE